MVLGGSNGYRRPGLCLGVLATRSTQKPRRSDGDAGKAGGGEDMSVDVWLLEGEQQLDAGDSATRVMQGN